ncbi:hypothetical protein ACJMK2_008006 [Sinanodonta woodiana]|uniref:Tyrosine decarboxylase n=1 Tax=Sinanodonta woodiana TaxID=1069815 RepID=A0ABD3VNG7_SINWO
MDSKEFRTRGKEMVDYIADYLDNIQLRRVTPEVSPGYLQKLLPDEAPNKGEDFSDIMKDVNTAIMKGVTHWQHPNFHAYFPAGNSFPSILGDMLSDAIGCVGFSWAASPACTELETVVLDWVGKMIGLPKKFLHDGGMGGGVIQGSASECVLINLLAARHQVVRQMKKRFQFIEEGLILSKLVAYSSKLAHSCVEKAGMIGFIKMRQLDVDEEFSLRGYTLECAIEEDRRMGLIPFFVCATLGTTACCSFDNILEIGQVCAKENVWLHIDAAYAGNALICPEFQYLIKGIENANSFNFNPNKWMLVNFDCSLMWVRDKDSLTSAVTVDPLYLKHKHDDYAIDFRHWGIPLSRRFRSLKLWFVLRTYGKEGLQNYIRQHVRLAKVFKSYVDNDSRFETMGPTKMGLVCFRLKGPNALTQKLLRMINESGKLHMVPALLNEYYIIRFAVCAENAVDEDIKYAWDIVSEMTEELMEMRQSLTDNKIEEPPSSDEIDKEVEENDEVFSGFDDEIIFDQQRNNLSRACMRRNLFFRMVSDPKSYNPQVLKALCTDKVKRRIDSSASEEDRKLLWPTRSLPSQKYAFMNRSNKDLVD